MIVRWLRLRTPTYWREASTTVLGALSAYTATGVFRSDLAPAWRIIAGSLITTLAVLSLRYAVREDCRRAPVARVRPEGAVTLNKKWLGEPGQAVVISRDLSWILDRELMEILVGKAERGELILVVGVTTPTIRKLMDAGATVRLYDQTKFRPHVRFTLLRLGASDARILLHRQSEGMIEFYEVQRDAFPTFSLAADLATLLSTPIRIAKER